MLKWILGCLGLVVIVVVCALWYGYRKLQTFTDQPPISTITIAAPPGRVFATLASADSMSTWMMNGTQVTSPHHGLLKTGDTVMMVGAIKDTLNKRAMWIVTAVEPDRLFAIEMRNERTSEVGITRRDSLVAVGDSTQVISSFATNLSDSTLKASAKSSTAKAAVDMIAKLMLTGLRLEGDQELKRIKNRIEGRAATTDSVVKPPN